LPGGLSIHIKETCPKIANSPLWGRRFIRFVQHGQNDTMKAKAIFSSTMLVATVILGVFALAPTASAHVCSYDSSYPDACGNPGNGCSGGFYHYHFKDLDALNPDCISIGDTEIQDPGLPL
jgi:hypothetical protein